jgi:phenylpropionate dioxygenase-like ring-hydroxylating dioxygenase large terminal subunit
VPDPVQEEIGMSPPTFEEAKNHRQRVRAAGLSPDYWYPVEWDRNLRRGQAIDVSFWNRSIAVFRGKDGSLNAIENRCAHRQMKLTLGEVGDCTITCAYHGWMYDGEGRCTQMYHDLFGHTFPRIRIASFPVQVKHGLIWIFPGDRALASGRQVPDIPELEGPRPWGSIALDFTWRAHHSMIIDNVSDFTHAYLHRKSRPFTEAKLTMMDPQPDRVLLAYDTKVGQGKISGLFVDRKTTNTNAMTLAYEYPYQWSNTDGKIKHWCFFLPIDERTTRTFFLFYFESLTIPLTPLRIPRRLMGLVLRISNRVLIGPLLSQDGFAVEAEQRGWEAHHDRPVPDLNPAVALFQQLTVRKWEEHLASAGREARERPAGALS